MAVKFKTRYETRVEGEVEIEIESEAGETESDLEDRAREVAKDEIESLLNENRYIDCVDTIDIKAIDIVKCEKCQGKGFTLCILDIGAGLMKAGPCPSCQRVPNTEEACNKVICIMKDYEQEEC